MHIQGNAAPPRAGVPESPSGIGPPHPAGEGGFCLGDGLACAAVVCPPPTGGCCLRTYPYDPHSCYMGTTPYFCSASNGLYLGDGSTCASNGCDDLFAGACCLTGPTGYPVCRTMMRSDCLAQGGGWVGPGTICGYAPYCG